jgi:tripartite-type tricarboxylate transporter receptor subunit TctC
LAKELRSASFYQGKTVAIVVGYKPGGGYDATARLLAKHLPKYLPDSPAVIVQNMPGANSIISANHVYSVAKPDGLTIGTFNRNLPLGQLTNVEGIKFDLRKFEWLGSASSETTILAIRSDLPHKALEDLKKAKDPVVIGTTGPGANTHDFPLLLKEYLGFNFKIVSGYSSSSDIMLAVERKEVDGRAGSYSSIKPFIDRGLVRAVIRTRATDPDIAKLPVDEELAPNAKAKTMLALRSAPEVIGRPYVAPPGTPADRMKILREAFEKTLKDPELLAEAKKARMPIEHVSPAQSLQVVNEILNTPRDLADEFGRHIKFGN